MLNNSREVPGVRRAAGCTWPDLKEITIGHKKQPTSNSRAWREKKQSISNQSQVDNSAGTRARGVQQAARGLA